MADSDISDNADKYNKAREIKELTKSLPSMRALTMDVPAKPLPPNTTARGSSEAMLTEKQDEQKYKYQRSVWD